MVNVPGVLFPKTQFNTEKKKPFVPKPVATPAPAQAPIPTNSGVRPPAPQSSNDPSKTLQAVSDRLKVLQSQAKTQNATNDSPVIKPEPKANPSQILQERISGSFNPTDAETRLSKMISNRLEAGEAGIEKIRGQAIPQGLLVGQAAALERQANAKLTPLQDQLKILQSQRTGQREADLTTLGFAQDATKTAADQQKSVQSIANSLITAGATAEQVQSVLGAADVNAALTAAASTGLLRAEEEIPTQVVQAGGRSLLVNTQTGETIQDLGATDSALSRAAAAAATASAAQTGRQVLNEFNESITPTLPPKPAIGGEDKAFTFFTRMNNAVQNLNELEDEITGLTLAEQFNLNFGNALTQDATLERIAQAQKEFTEARLRKDSGAAIPPEEFKNDRETYFPQPGNDETTLAQKAASREAALRAVRLESGNAYWEFFGESPTAVGQRIIQDNNSGQGETLKTTGGNTVTITET